MERGAGKGDDDAMLVSKCAAPIAQRGALGGGSRLSSDVERDEVISLIRAVSTEKDKG